MIRTSTIIRFSAACLILLFVYTASSKLLDLQQFRVQLSRQTLPAWLKVQLIWILPGTEIAASVLLMFRQTRRGGFWLSFLLLSAFTVYIILALTGYFGKVPCSCGGVIQAMGWHLHLWFNIFFVLLTCLAIGLQRKEVERH